MPTNTPTDEQRTTSQKWRKVSLTPSQTPAPSFAAGALPAIEVPRTARSMISGMAKMPTSTGIEIEPLPEVDQAEVEAQDARLALLADGGEQQAEEPHGEALELRAGAAGR